MLHEDTLKAEQEEKEKKSCSDVSIGTGLHNSAIFLLVAIFCDFLVLQKRSFLIYGIRTNFFNVVKDYAGLVK